MCETAQSGQIQRTNSGVDSTRDHLNSPAGRGSKMHRQRQQYYSMKAYIYCRTANSNPVALQAQKVACIAYCKREGLMVAKVFSDVNIPARTVGPGLRDLIRVCRTGGKNVHHLVLYATVDSAWITHALADALAPSAIAEPVQHLKGEDCQCSA
jgi:hypothetical protein